uniref:Globin family profile domain-containing protein n=1 Tax=Ditylenchus dipsaci TaxID=166011 RepID=A0A915EA17_9BILA
MPVSSRFERVVKVVKLERKNSNSQDKDYGWVMEAAASGFYAARQRYRKRRSSRSGSSGGGGDGAGSSTPKVRRIISKHSGRELHLEDDQCEQLAEAFFLIPDKYYAFEKMFLKLFVHDDPQIAIVFGLQDVPEVELRRRTPFRTHVCKFQRFMTTVMDLVTKPGREEELIQIIRMVGRQHCNVKLLSFTAARWLSFKAALLATFAKNEQDKWYPSWTILISFIIMEMKDAYLAHIRHLRSNSLPHVLETYKKLELDKLEFRKKSTQTGEGDGDTISVSSLSLAAKL